MRLLVLYRTHGGSNDKARPPYFSRALSLRSLRAALAQSGVETTFVFIVDGSMSDELAPMVRDSDSVVQISGGSAAASLRASIDVALSRAAALPDDTVFWFAEDDYLYRAESIKSLAEAVAAYAGVDYFSLYVPDDSDWHATHPSQPYYAVAASDLDERRLGQTRWIRTRQTTSTFGVRRQALLHDAWLLKLGTRVGSPFDAATWVALQRMQPFPWRHIFRDVNFEPTARGFGKVVARPVMRMVLNIVARWTPHRARILVSSVPDQAVHLEAAMLPPDAGWDQVAATT